MLKEKDMLTPPDTSPPPSISNLYLTCEAFLLTLCEQIALLADASIQYTGERWDLMEEKKYAEIILFSLPSISASPPSSLHRTTIGGGGLSLSPGLPAIT